MGKGVFAWCGNSLPRENNGKESWYIWLFQWEVINLTSNQIKFGDCLLRWTLGPYPWLMHLWSYFHVLSFHISISFVLYMYEYNKYSLRRERYGGRVERLKKRTHFKYTYEYNTYSRIMLSFKECDTKRKG